SGPSGSSGKRNERQRRQALTAPEVTMPGAAKRDELVTVLLERLDRFESALSAVQQAITRIEEAEKQTRTATAAATVRMDGLEKRLNDLEAAKNRAEGAAAGAGWLWKLLTAAGLISGGAAVRHWLGGGK